MSRLSKKFAVAFVVAVLSVTFGAAAASADGGGSTNGGPRCCV
jgi:hypothetical protein